MLKKLIFIENNKSYQFNEEVELIEFLMGTGYYTQTSKDKIRQMKLNALAKCLGTKFKIIEINKQESDLIDVKGKFLIYDEKTYVLSLLLTGRGMLLERKDSNIYTEKINKKQIYVSRYECNKKLMKENPDLEEKLDEGIEFGSI